MPKELEFRFDDESILKKNVKKLKKEFELKEKKYDTSEGYALANKTRSLQIQILPPDKKVNQFIVITRITNDQLTEEMKAIFGEPLKERIVSPSILEVAEYITGLPKDLSEIEIQQKLEEELQISQKYRLFKKMILKHGDKSTSREVIKKAADRLRAAKD
ncbi:MAG: hypothetical protein EU542_06645 [Promethearchaeota archaeon]|nr:MAG: hypothetical protein EU542_06645 [Candidatus Lokiarchaeota archaeon]